MASYWEKYWNGVGNDNDVHRQVGRTSNKNVIQNNIFEETVDWVADKMQINEKSDILELCCGNGAWTIPFSKRVKNITAIDFSAPLIEVLKKRCVTENIKNLNIKLGDITKINPNDCDGYTHVFLYFAIQHLSEREVVFLFENVYKVLKNSDNSRCIFYIGDIPDKQKLWCFANTKEYEKMYFDSVKDEKPAIGTWFMKDDLLKLSEYVGFKSCEILEQPIWQINSRYRFDMKMEIL